jgi:hypothetical protein
VSPFNPEAVVEEGQRVLKYCEASGDTPMMLTWLKNSIALSGAEAEGITTQDIRY